MRISTVWGEKAERCSAAGQASDFFPAHSANRTTAQQRMALTLFSNVS